ncbi:hypothetical protein GOV12_04420, partial [Candidatus Pacearchaeota archaeon]|nr:hypothetical protein [Candidatus Pacearchaeota archaeon]
GDGLVDIVQLYYDYPSTEFIKQEVWINNASKGYLLKNITTPFGGKISIDYKRSTYLDNTGNDSISDLGFNLWVVSNITKDNGMGGNHNVISVSEYNYSGGKYTYYPKNEFRGFNYVEEKTDNKKTKHWFLQGDGDKGRENETKIMDDNDNLYLKKEYVWNSTENNGYYITQLAEESEYNYDNISNNPRIKNISYTYDVFGNKIKIHFKGDVNYAGDDRYEYYDFVNNSDLWIVDKVVNYTLTDSNGNRVSNTLSIYDNLDYDEAPIKGSLTSKEDWLDSGDNPTINYSYNIYGNLVNETDANGHLTEYLYDIRDTTFTFIDSINDSKGFKINFNYDLGTGNLLWTADSNGIYTNYTYDVFGRIEKEILPYDSELYPTKVYEYDFNSSAPEKIKIMTREENGTSNTYDKYIFYDGFGKLIQTKKESDNSKQIVNDIYYDKFYRVNEHSNPYLIDYFDNYSIPNQSIKKINYTYDQLGRIIEIINPDDSKINISYAHWNITLYDENGQRKEYEKNAFDKIIEVREYNSGDIYKTKYNYDVFDNIIGIIDSLSNVFNYSYDSVGRKINISDPDLGIWNYSYDNVGNLIGQKDNKNIISSFSYDELNRIIKKNNSEEEIIYIYDKNQNNTLSSVESINLIVNYSYDNRLRKVSEQKLIDGIGFVLNWSYDAMNRVIVNNLPEGSEITFNYNDQGRMFKIQDVINISYNENDRPVVRIYKNDLVTNYSYDSENYRLDNIRTEGKQNLNYSYDLVGNVKQINDTANNRFFSMIYDDLDRLIFTSIINYSLDVDNLINFSYNAIGNMINMTSIVENITLEYGSSLAHAPIKMIHIKKNYLEDCSIISEANSIYYLKNNIINNDLIDNCINITAENVTLNCNGYYIQSDDNVSGVYSNQYNTTIMNCNISMGIEDGGYGIELEGSNNSLIINNTLNNQYNGIILFSSFNNILTNITSNNNNYSGVYLYSGSNNNLTDIISNNNGYYGTILYASSDNILTDITSNNNLNSGIYLYYSSNNTLINITSSNNLIDGIFITDTSNNLLTNITANNNSVHGIIIGSSSNNSLTDITSNDNQDGIHFSSNSNNTLTKIISYNNDLHGIYFTASSNNNIMDSNISNSGAYDIKSVSSSGNNYFINCSYDLLKENISANSELIRKWYYMTYVNDSDGNAVNGANVSAYNSSDNIEFSYLTNISGWINRIEIIDYVNVGGNKNYYSNYTINATNITSTDEHTFNVTIEKNNLEDNLVLQDSISVTNCNVLDTANTLYIQTANILNNSLTDNCINIVVENVTLDCAGYYIKSENDENGIYSNSTGTTIKNCNVSMGNSGGRGIYLLRAHDSYIFNNSLNDTNTGLYLAITNNSVIEDNIIKENNYLGISVSSSSNNIFIDNIINDNGIGFWITGAGSSNNSLINLLVYNNDNQGIRFSIGSHKLISVNSSNNSEGLYLWSSQDNIIQDSIFSLNTKDIHLDQTSTNNSFTNSSFSIEDVESGSELTRKWYYMAYVNDSDGNAVNGANVSAYNSSDNIGFSYLTNSSGWINRIEITDYVNVGGSKNYYGDYIINATNITFTDEHSFDVTFKQNKLDDLFTLDDVEEAPPIVIDFVPPTPDDDSTQYNDNIYVNLSTFDEDNHYSFVDFDRDVVLWLRMDDINASGDPWDRSSYSNNGTAMNGAVQNESGYFGKGFEFGGYMSGDDIRVNNIDFNPGEVTYSIWIRPNDITNDWDGIFTNSAEADGASFADRMNILTASTDGKIYAYNSYDLSIPSANCFITKDTWSHVVVVVSNSSQSAKMYINGSECGEDTSFNINVTTPGNYNIIGARANLINWNGTIDDVIVFNRTLDANEILSLYNASSNQYYHNFTDLTIGVHNFTGYVVDIDGNLDETEEINVEILSPVINISIIYPTSDISVTQNQFFNITVNVSCLLGNCGTINATLDPIPENEMTIELTDKRTYNQKVFSLGNKDVRYRIYSGHIHYKDNEEFMDIDTDLVSTDSGWEMNKASYSVNIPKYSDDSFEFTNNYEDNQGDVVSMKPIVVNNVGGVLDSDNSVVYSDAFGSGIDLKVIAKNNGFDKLIIINEKPEDLENDLEFKYEININGFDVKSDRGLWDKANSVQTSDSIVLDKTGETFLREFRMWDSSGKSFKINVKLEMIDSKYYLIKILDKELLENAIYPVVTDDTVSYYSGNGDGYVGNGGSDWDTIHDASSGSSYDYTSITAGSMDYYSGSDYIIYRSFVPIDTSGIDDSSVITSASLYLYGDTIYNDLSPCDVHLVQTTQSSSSSLYYDDFNQVGNTEGTPAVDIGYLYTSSYNQFDLNSTGKAWIDKSGTTYLGLRTYYDFNDIDPDDGYQSGYCWFNYKTSEESGTDKDPYLEIDSYIVGKGIIPFTIGVTPFYTNETNPRMTSSLSQGESETVVYWVNATGNLGTYEFFAFTNLTSDLSVGKMSDIWYVDIV